MGASNMVFEDLFGIIPILSRKTVYNITGTTPDGVNMRRLKLDWKESEEELKTLYLKEKDAQNRMRLQGLWLLRQGRHIRDVAAAIGCHPRTVQDWIAWYRQGGLAEVLRHRHGGHTSQRCRLSQEKIAELKQKAAEGQFRRIQDAVDWVKERYKVTYTWSGMYSLFRREGLRKKVPRPANPKASSEEQEAWKKGGFVMP
jgi:transposase